jgi:hypothetical protein
MKLVVFWFRLPVVFIFGLLVDGRRQVCCVSQATPEACHIYI